MRKVALDSVDSQGVEMTTEASTVAKQIRTVLTEHARLSIPVDSINDHEDLFRAGMTSHASVNVMLGLEDAFDVEFPESMLRKSTFETIAAIERSVNTLLSAADS
jgi:acyl carrier protein